MKVENQMEFLIKKATFFVRFKTKYIFADENETFKQYTIDY